MSQTSDNSTRNWTSLSSIPPSSPNMSSYNTDSDDVESIASDISPIDTEFDGLVEDIRSVLGTSSGIDSDDVDVNDLMNFMRSYSSEESHWKEYAMGDPSRCYTRNLVDEGNGKANLLILVWSPGKGSLIHDHANAHCIMKILKGSLVEDLYDWPKTEVITAPHDTTSGSSMTLRKTTVLRENDVAYMSDKIGLHRISNPDSEQVAVSLHLYTPPYAAKYGCSKFDEKTGKATHVPMCEYYSKYGKRSEKGCAGNTC